MDEISVRGEMNSILELVKSDVATIRTGRASPSLVEDIVVSVYGGTQKLRVVELASINTVGPDTLVVEPWDKSIIGEIRQGILSSKAGFNPVIDGEKMRISLPPLTTEDRQRYVKLLNTKLEQGRVMIRKVRGDLMHEVRKAYEEKALSEDDKFREEKRIQELTDEFIEKINAIGESKQKELLQT